MQTLLVIIFAAGLVLFGISRFGISPEEITQKLGDSIVEETQQKQESVNTQFVTNSGDISKLENVTVVDKDQAEKFSQMPIPVEPTIDTVLQDENSSIKEGTQPSQQITDPLVNPLVDTSVNTSVDSLDDSFLSIAGEKEKYISKHTMDDVFSVNQNIDNLLQQYSELKGRY